MCFNPFFSPSASLCPSCLVASVVVKPRLSEMGPGEVCRASQQPLRSVANMCAKLICLQISSSVAVFRSLDGTDDDLYIFADRSCFLVLTVNCTNCSGYYECCNNANYLYGVQIPDYCVFNHNKVKAL